MHSCSAFVEREWRQGRQSWIGGDWPEAVWIRLHDPLPVGVDSLRTPIRRAWFLDERGVREPDHWTFRRFWTVQVEQPWSLRKEPYMRPGTGLHPIALAGFAAYERSSDVYAETVWGGLYGHGYRFPVNEQGLLGEPHELWRS